MLIDQTKALQAHQAWPTGAVYLLLTGKQDEDLSQEETDAEYAEIIKEQKRQLCAEAIRARSTE